MDKVYQVYYKVINSNVYLGIFSTFERALIACKKYFGDDWSKVQKEIGSSYWSYFLEYEGELVCIFINEFELNKEYD